jgi:hypothetical protein
MRERARRARAVFDAIEARLPWLPVVLAGVLAFRRLDNSDTWWHLAAGRWIAEHATVPRTDPLSFTVATHRWTDLQWLFELVLYGLHRLGGPTALVVAATVSYAATIALLVANLRVFLGPSGTTLLALWALAVAQERFAIRPEMASFPLLEAVILVCTTGRRTGSRLWLLPLLMLVWANMHSLFVIGAFVIACHVAATFVEQWLPTAWREPPAPDATRALRRAGVAALVVTTLTPYGPAGALFPMKLMSRINGSNPAFASIGEFRPPFSGYFPTFAVTAYQALIVFAGLVVVAACLAVVTNGRRGVAAPRAERRRGGGVEPRAEREAQPAIDVAGVAVLVGLGWLSLLARRNMALFALGATPVVGRCLAVVAARVRLSGWRLTPVVRRGVPAVIIPFVAFAAWFVASNRFYRANGDLHECGAGVLRVMFPVRAAAFARAVELPAPAFNDLTTGGYLAWERPIPGGVYIDGRLEVYDTEFFTRYVRALAEPARWQADVDAAGVQSVVLFHWWPNHAPLVRWLLRDRRWALVYYDEVVLVFVRREGHDDVIARAAEEFRARRAGITGDLLAGPSSWQWPVGQARGLATYAALLDVMGRADEAVPFWEHLLALGPRPRDAAGVAIRLADYHAARGETALARTYLQTAIAADRTNPAIRIVAGRLGR